MLAKIVIASKLCDQVKGDDRWELEQLFVLNRVQLFPGLHGRRSPSLCQQFCTVSS